jgi:O-succinylbenzoic acid--CoA ligase
LPTRHIAGVNVVVRSLLAGAVPAVEPPGHFTAEAFAAAAAAHADARYCSLVPTQLTRLLADAAATRALTGFAAVLVGGAASAPGFLEAARERGVRVVETYGCAETAGGCVYDGVPLDGVAVRLGPDGRLELAGPTLALGYATAPPSAGVAAPPHPAADHPSPGGGDVAEPASDGFTEPASDGFTEAGGRRWFRTRDLGVIDAAGHVTVLGRADDVIVSGGVKVVPQRVETLLKEARGVADAAVVGVADPEWGQVVTAVIVPGPGGRAPDLTALRARVGAAIGPENAPKRLLTAGHLPYLAPGKLDRHELAVRAARAVMAGWAAL